MWTGTSKSNLKTSRSYTRICWFAKPPYKTKRFMHILYRIYSELYCLTEVVGHLNAAGIVHEILVDGHSMFSKSKEK